MTFLSLIESLTEDTNSINKILKEQIHPRSENQLNWKASAEKWSVLECLEHIMLSGQYYIDEINNSFSSKSPGLDPLDLDFKPGIIGNYSVKAMKPAPSGEINNKMKTFKRMEPGKSNMDHEKILADFSRYQADLLSILEKSKYFNLNKIKIRSSIGNMIRFKLGDALRFVIAHNQRHVQQAINVMKSDGFPVANSR
jgi:hypothetical protein